MGNVGRHVINVGTHWLMRMMRNPMMLRMVRSCRVGLVTSVVSDELFVVVVDEED